MTRPIGFLVDPLFWLVFIVTILVGIFVVPRVVSFVLGSSFNGHVSFALNHQGFSNVEWEGRTSKDDEARTRIHAGRVALQVSSLFRPSKLERRSTRAKRWVGIGASNVRVTIPKSHITRRLESAMKKKVEALKKPSRPSWIKAQAQTLGLSAFRAIRRLVDHIRALVPLNVVGLALNVAKFFLDHIAIKLKDVTIELEDVGELHVSLRIGFEARGERLGGYLAIDELALYARPTEHGPNEPVLRIGGGLLSVTSTVQADRLRSLVKTGVNSKVQIRDHSLEIRLAFPQSDPVYVHVDALQQIVRDLSQAIRESEDTARERSSSPNTDRLLRIERQGRRMSSAPSVPPPPQSRRQNLGAALRLVQLDLPSLQLAVHKTVPEDRASELRYRSVGFLAALKGFHAQAEFGPDTSKGSHPHHKWHGKSGSTVVRASLGWKEWQFAADTNLASRAWVDVALLTHTVDPERHQIAHFGGCEGTLSSTWFPYKLDSFMRPHETTSQRETRQSDVDAARVVLDVDVAEFRANIDIERLSAMLSVISALPDRPKPAPRSRRRSKILSDLPCVYVALSLGPSEVRLYGATPPSQPVYGPGEDSNDSPAPSLPETNSPDICMLSVPFVKAHLETDFVEISVARAFSERHDLKRLMKRGAFKVPPSLVAPLTGQTIDVFKSVDGVQVGDEERITADGGVFMVPTMGFWPGLQFNHDDQQHRLVCRISSGVKSGALAVRVQSNLGITRNLRRSDDAPRQTLPLMTVGPTHLDVDGHFHGWFHNYRPEIDLRSRILSVEFAIDEADISIWHPRVISILQDLAEAFDHRGRKQSPPPSYQGRSRKPITDLLPSDILVHAALGPVTVRIAGPDPATKTELRRGIEVTAHSSAIQFLLRERGKAQMISYAQRAKLTLPEDIRTQAAALNAEAASSPAALFKFNIEDVEIDPIIDAQDEYGGGLNRAEPWKLDGYRRTRKISVLSPFLADQAPRSRWEYIRAQAERKMNEELPPGGRRRSQGLHSETIKLPSLSLRLSIRDMPESAIGYFDTMATYDDCVLTAELQTPIIKVSAMHVYCSLLTVSTVKSLMPGHRRKVAEQRNGSKEPSQPTTPDTLMPKRRMVLHVEARARNFDVFVVLPNNVRLFLRLHNLEAFGATRQDGRIRFASFLAAAVSPTAPQVWEDIGRITNGDVKINHAEGEQREWSPLKIEVDSDAFRLRVPYKYAPADIFDNSATLIKTCKQLAHQFIKGSLDYILTPEPEEPKQLPEVIVRSQTFVITAMDDPFEVALNRIWRTGCEVQPRRAAQQDALDARVAQLREQRAHHRECGGCDDHGDLVAFDPQEVQRRLDEYNAQSWIKRIERSHAELRHREEQLARRTEGRLGSMRPEDDLPIVLRRAGGEVPLARAVIRRFDLHVTRPSFYFSQLPNWMHDVGNGMPRDSKYTLIIPVHLDWRFQDVKITLRDYPLPLFQISAPSDGSHDNWHFHSDIVIAEQMPPDDRSIRHVDCDIFPGLESDGENVKPYTITVPRTAMPMKFYARPTIDISTDMSTRVGWGNSVSPAIADLVRVFESFTKVPPDPSERIGASDKVRLQMHGRLLFRFIGGGSLLFHLKGSRDPYKIDGNGMGLVKAYSGDVRVRLGFKNHAREFLQIDAQRYLLGVPDLGAFKDLAATGAGTDHDRKTPSDDSFDTIATEDALAVTDSAAKDLKLRKVLVRLQGGVRWGMAIVLERTCVNHCSGPTFKRQCRFWTFLPHYQVVTHTAEGMQDIKDSYDGFRSDFVHFSISVTSPLPPESYSDPGLDACSRWPGIPNLGEPPQNNSFHFSPGVMAQFWDNWRLFDSTMSLPIRQGQLFPSPQPPSKKFGRHTATIKYRLDIAPLFIAHTYNQAVKADWARGVTSVLGVKGRFRHIRMDLHQRATEETIERKERKDSVKVIHKRFYEAEIDAKDIEFRAIHATFSDPLKAETCPSEWADQDEPDMPLPEALSDSEHKIWIDQDDYVDVHWHPPPVGQRYGTEHQPVKVAPTVYRAQTFLTCPRITYFKRPVDSAKTRTAEDLERKSSSSGSSDDDGEDSKPHSKFGDEPSHLCLIGHAPGAFGSCRCRSDARRTRHRSDRSRQRSNRAAQATAQRSECA